MKLRVSACVFDAYGTLFDVHSAVRTLSERIGPDADEFSRLWRTKQLEYTWVRSLAGRHADFRQVTEEALDFSISFFSLKNKSLKDDLLFLYKNLDTFPEVGAVLRQLRATGLRLAILSNGTPEWLESAVGSAGLAAYFDAIWSVEEVGIFKPDARVYRMATQGLSLSPADIAFVSSNPWDAAGAAVNGFRSLRVNRTKGPAEYSSMAAVPEIGDLSALPQILVK